MTELDAYLAKHYLRAEQLAAAAALTVAQLDALIAQQLAPMPAYEVSEGRLRSFVFGDMAAPGAVAGRFFPPAQLAWISLARQTRAQGDIQQAQAQLQQQFAARYGAALAVLNLTTWRLPDCFDDTGAAIADGLRARTDSAWRYFLNGTFSLCVANPVSEAHIATKEVLQEKLVQLSDNGSKTSYTAQELALLPALIDAYAAAAMPFSPVEYVKSSRKRLVEDLRAKLPAVQ